MPFERTGSEFDKFPGSKIGGSAPIITIAKHHVRGRAICGPGPESPGEVVGEGHGWEQPCVQPTPVHGLIDRIQIDLEHLGAWGGVDHEIHIRPHRAIQSGGGPAGEAIGGNGTASRVVHAPVCVETLAGP